MDAPLVNFFHSIKVPHPKPSGLSILQKKL